MTELVIGDRTISSWDHKLWSLTYHVLQEYKTPVRFNFQLGSAPGGYDSNLTWYIPHKAKNYQLIHNYLLNQFKNDIRKGEWLDFGGSSHYSMGLSVQIMPFSEPGAYMEEAILEEMCRSVMKNVFNQTPKKLYAQAFFRKIGLNYTLDAFLAGAVLSAVGAVVAFTIFV